MKITNVSVIKYDEARYQRDVVLGLQANGFVVQPHDEKCVKNVPDFSFAGSGVDGWVELKWLNTQPKTLRHIRHFTDGQRQWLIDTGKAGSGNCYLWVGGLNMPHVIISHQHLLSKYVGIPFTSMIDEYSFVVDRDLQSATKEFVKKLIKYIDTNLKA